MPDGSPGAVGADPKTLASADVVLLVGGTDGGDREVLLHNAAVLGRSPLRAPIVLAGNKDAAAEALELLRRRGRVALQAGNVIPRIGELAPDLARAAIRSVFIEHVIGGKGLSTGSRFGRLVRCATPDAVLAGVEVLAGRPGPQAGGDVLVVDIGGATTDVYSVLQHVDTGEQPPGVVGQAAAARTVEGDLGMRWSAPDLLHAAQSERLIPLAGVRSHPDPGRSPSFTVEITGLEAAAARRHAEVGFLPSTRRELDEEMVLAEAAATIAVRRHARPGATGRDLRHVGLVIGSGGVLRHAPAGPALAVLAGVLNDRAGGWARPVDPTVIVDTDYLLAPIGLLALSGHRAQAEVLADQLLAAAGDVTR